MNRNKHLLTVRFLYFFIGVFILSLGIALIIEASLGASSWDVLHVGLYKTLGLTVGVWSQLVGVIIVTITFFLDRSYVHIGTILNTIFVGLFLDLFLFILPEVTNIYLQYITLLVGTFLSGFGAALYITPKLGPGPRDGLVLVLSKRLNLGFGKVKTAIELLVLLIGWKLGGPFFVGTLIVSVLIGPIIQYFLVWWEKRIGDSLKPTQVYSTNE